jgi:hypothetical protein
VLYVEPDEPPMLLATGTEEGLLDGAWTLDAPPVGARLIVVGAERALSDRSPEELLALPHDAELSLR